MWDILHCNLGEDFVCGSSGHTVQEDVFTQFEGEDEVDIYFP